MVIAKSMLEKGLNSPREYAQLEKEMLRKYHPKLDPLLSALP